MGVGGGCSRGKVEERVALLGTQVEGRETAGSSEGAKTRYKGTNECGKSSNERGMV